MKKLLLITVAALLAVSVWAEGRAYTLSTDSVDPHADSLAIEKMRHKMDSVRGRRPVVGLVFSGGGAKGAAHVGVLKYLEEMEIPVDLITGTSMGGLIGGLYALGYDAAQLDTLVRTADWDLILSDRVDPQSIPYASRQYRNTFALEIPFKYDGKDFERKDLLSSLPSGYISGLNVNEIFSDMSVDYHGDIDFTELPIPFCCVASDLVSGKAKNWTSGSLVKAMRSTMSIPGLFEPVRVDGMVLMDGGTRNNFPTDLARAMGADIVIGVDLSDKDKTYDEVNNVGDVLMQSISMLGMPAFEKNVTGVDVLVKPDMTGYNMLSFDTEKISVIIGRGYEAAAAVGDELMAVKAAVGDCRQQYQAPPAKDLRSEKVLISAIEFNGVQENESRYLSGRLPLEVGKEAGTKEIRAALSALYATGTFKSVEYHLTEDSGGYRLAFDCVKGPIHRFGIGGRLDSEQFAELYVNTGFYAYKLTGFTFDITARLGLNLGMNLRCSYDLPNWPTFNLEAGAFRPRTVLNDYGEDFNVSFWRFGAKAYLSNLKRLPFDWRLGVRYDYDMTDDIWARTDFAHLPELGDKKEAVASAFIDGGVYTLDNKAFPTSGLELKAGYRWAFDGGEDCYKGSFHTVDFYVRKAFSFTPRLSMSVAFDTRLFFSRGESSLFTRNYVGGTMRGRYFDQQMPFVGFIYPASTGDMLTTLQIEPSVRIFRKMYASLIAGVLKESDSFADLIGTPDRTYWGAGAQLGYNFMFGPLKFVLGWNSLREDWTLSASIGLDF